MKKIVMIALVALTFVACEKEIEVDIEGTDPKVVVNSLNEVGRPVSLHLTYSRPVFSTFYVPTGSSYFEEVDNATVNLTVNGADVGTAVRDGGTYSFGYVPSEGDQLDLRVVVPGEDPITASAIVPSRPMVKGVDVKYLENSETDEYDYYYDYDVDIRLTLMDKAATAVCKLFDDQVQRVYANLNDIRTGLLEGQLDFETEAARNVLDLASMLIESSSAKLDKIHPRQEPRIILQNEIVNKTKKELVSV